jgi:SAM-dependent methyltransferase
MNSNPSAREKFEIVKRNFEILGFWTTLRMILAYLLSGPPRDTFDRKHRVSTAGVVEPQDAGIPEAVVPDAIRYVPTNERVMRHVLTNLAIDYRDYVFVDLGCGKGRAVLIASEFPFGRVIGVELSPKTSALARENVALFAASARSRCKNVEIRCENALDFRIPNSSVVFYLYHPFREPVLEKVLENIRAASNRDRRILIAYCCPANEELLEKSGFLRKIKEFQLISIEHSWNLWDDSGSDGSESSSPSRAGGPSVDSRPLASG